ncbi:MAG TPA: DoxX family protein [Terriglobales bacterium]|jgi:putative oxidoreductase|nr:DoxX family protein [Terriglobales bacterium]
MKTVSRVLAWTILISVASLFVMLGLAKFTGQSSIRWAERFAHWGYPMVFRYVVGGLEILGGIGLIAPATTRPAAAVLMVVMAGAFYTHLSHGEMPRIVPPLMLGTLVLLIFLWRHPLRHVVRPSGQ